MMGRCVKIATFIVSVMAVTLLAAGAARADIGPAQIYAEGGALKPAANTNVSMESEKVVLTYKQPEKLSGDTGFMVMRAHVTAQFKMNNPSQNKQTMKLYFPADDAQYAGGMGVDTDITNFSVNGAKLTSNAVQVEVGSDTFGYSGKGGSVNIKAYQWDQSFPAGETTITVEYDTMSGQQFEMYDLTYVLGTGRNWSGPIKQGEVDFVFPDKVQPYAVTGDVPLLKENKLAYTIEDKTIKVAFTDYEPASGDVIVLGIADPTVVGQIEKAKQVKPQTVDSTINIASLFRGLSVGAHCYLCVDPAAEISKSYYTQAFNMAKSKDEVNKVMQSLAFGGQTGEYQTFAKMYEWFDYFTKNRACDVNDSNCSTEEYMFSNVTPFGPAQASFTSAPSNADLLALYACRLRPYDLTASVAVEDYANKRYESCPTKEPQTDQNAMTTPSETKLASQNTASQNQINWLLLAGIVAGSWVVLGVIIVVIAAISRHHRNKTAKRGTGKPTEVKQAQKEPKTEKTEGQTDK